MVLSYDYSIVSFSVSQYLIPSMPNEAALVG
jgi:hypothetical protein